MLRVFIRSHHALNADDISEYQFHRNNADSLAKQQSNHPRASLRKTEVLRRKRRKKNATSASSDH